MIIAAVCGVILLLIPRWWSRRADKKHRALLAAQLRTSLEMLVQALRVGVGFQQALDRIARDGPEPLAAEWRAVRQSVDVGVSLPEALAEAARRVPVKEMAWFVTSVRITLTTGGSLADVLESLAVALQERQALREKLEALTAQGRASGILLSAIPFILLAVLFFIVPEQARLLFTTTTGQWMLAGVIGSVAIGGCVIQSIVTMEEE